ncbi:MAG TPA: hemerythrin domain-containing protein [Bryobacteraceae bacterium]|nr:hemerythrin domain-containing protein [Bryobacteraceae bacterium]
MGAYMFDWFSLDNNFLALQNTDTNAIELLKSDHAVVKDLFAQFEKSAGRSSKKRIADRVLTELKVHAAIEEEIFYPAVRKRIGKDIMNEADEEHHVAKLLVAELDDLKGRGDHYDAKFKVLAENVRHHIKEEEDEMLPKAAALDLDFQELGRRMLRRKRQLLSKGVPPVGEEAMVAATHSRGDSPAKAAHRRPRPLKKRSA